jgi:probable F420-dependent oxidoreductase
MLFSVGLPTGMEGLMYPVPFAGIDEIVNIAKRAEALGYHSVWGNDHMTTQRYVKAEFSAVPRYWEPIVTYSYIAAETTRLKFGTGLLVLPMRRDIVVTAKQIATVDHLSRGRLEIGIGVGAYREEFEALQPGIKAHRGNMVGEGVQALRKLFEERSASFDGDYYKFSMVELSPKPYQKRFPLYLGGNNINAVERAARYGDGWLPAGIPIGQLSKGVARLRELVAAEKRSMSEMQIAPQYICRIARTREKAIAEFRDSQIAKHLESLRASTLKEQGDLTFEEINLIGSADDIRAKVQIAREVGVTHMLGTLFAANSVPDLLEQMQMFAEEVVEPCMRT